MLNVTIFEACVAYILPVDPISRKRKAQSDGHLLQMFLERMYRQGRRKVSDQLVLNFVTILKQKIKHCLILRRLNSSPGVRSNEIARTMARD